MKKIFSKKLFSSKGFTLVELLVVIGILGILAAGLLATIDPLEQFRKGTDSNSKTTSLELVNALTRYYASHSVMPWAATASGGAACYGGGTSAPTAIQISNVDSAGSFDTCLSVLVSEGELKDTTRVQYGILNKLYISDLTSGQNVKPVVCFNPLSKSVSSDKVQTLYDASAVSSTSCPDGAGASNCYWCAQ